MLAAVAWKLFSGAALTVRISRIPLKIRWVVKNGEVWEAETMKKLWPHEEPPPKFFWKHEAETKAARKCGKDCAPLAWACTKDK